MSLPVPSGNGRGQEMCWRHCLRGVRMLSLIHILAAFAVYALARLTGASRTTIVLAGVAVNALMSACMDAIVTLVPLSLIHI